MMGFYIGVWQSRNYKQGYCTIEFNKTSISSTPIPFNVRYALTDTSLPGALPDQPPITVVSGDAVFYSTIAMQRLEKLYPPPTPASIFSLERWEDWQPRSWQYVPFNGGPRICVGQNFVLTEMAYDLVRLVQKYERVEYRGNWDDQYHKVEIVGTPGIPIKVELLEK